jgi:hypothetical protein
VIEVYSSHWGPCTSIIPTLKRIKVERDPDPKAFQYNPVRGLSLSACREPATGSPTQFHAPAQRREGRECFPYDCVELRTCRIRAGGCTERRDRRPPSLSCAWRHIYCRRYRGTTLLPSCACPCCIRNASLCIHDASSATASVSFLLPPLRGTTLLPSCACPCCIRNASLCIHDAFMLPPPPPAAASAADGGCGLAVGAGVGREDREP